MHKELESPLPVFSHASSLFPSLSLNKYLLSNLLYAKYSFKPFSSVEIDTPLQKYLQFSW